MPRLLRTAWLAVTLALASASALTSAPAHAGELRRGQPLPAVRLLDWSGQARDLTQTRGHVAVIDFWASWCTTCRAALPALDAISQRHADLTVIAINIDKTRAAADRFLAEHVPQVHMTMLRDPDGAALARLGAVGMPALYVVDRDGVVRLVEVGYAPERLQDVEALIRELLDANPG